MDFKTRWALGQAIKKWEGVVAGTVEDHGSDNCALCKLFITGHGEACLGCPVAEKVGRSLCLDTPYMPWSRALLNHPDNYATTPELKAFAQKELDFLRALYQELYGLPTADEEHQSRPDTGKRTDWYGKDLPDG